MKYVWHIPFLYLSLLLLATVAATAHCHRTDGTKREENKKNFKTPTKESSAWCAARIQRIVALYTVTEVAAPAAAFMACDSEIAIAMAMAMEIFNRILSIYDHLVHFI